MDQVKHSLCPACDACPEVTVLADRVRIGEAGNEVVLTRDEWNVLVDLVRAGRLGRLS
jgi:hypothetical protein